MDLIYILYKLIKERQHRSLNYSIISLTTMNRGKHDHN